MTTLKSLLLGMVAGLAITSAARAELVVAGSVGGAPTGVTYENFDGLPLGIAGGLTPSGVMVNFTPNAAAVQGSQANIYAAPFLSGGNGMGFGSPNQANGVDETTFLTTGSTGSMASAMIELKLPDLQKYFGLLWGSVDDYNSLSFYNDNTLVGSITGADVTASPNGDRGVNGTLYVNINSTLDFNRVVATSSQFAFEFDNVAFNRTPIPEPASLMLFGAGLLGLGMVMRKRRQA
ncbi:PEP-CTERM sorting domain-containing protein [Roseomonas sp. CCTCC AB2023176]|uniref:Npun_F0296 family exosortase-dependent surface protein n=1 Tax=Roseomonas sp. CCTCC AB2023176 TaxID=3342640 RepID=UPI0035DF4653